MLVLLEAWCWTGPCSDAGVERWLLRGRRGAGPFWGTPARHEQEMDKGSPRIATIEAV